MLASVVALALAFSTGSAWSGEAALAEGKLFQQRSWTSTTHIAEIDSRVLAELKLRRDPISDHGGPFNPTDEVTGTPLPAARLVLAGHAGDRWFVCLEVGGVAHVLYLVVFRVGEHSADVCLFASGSAAQRDAPGGWSATVSELKEALRDGRLAVSDPVKYLPRIGGAMPVPVAPLAAAVTTCTMGYLVLPVPEGYVCEQDRGPDFSVYYASRPGQSGRSSIGVYIGNAPTSFAPGAGVSEAETELGHHSTKWRLWLDKKTGSPDRYMAELTVEKPFGTEPSYATYIHMFVIAKSESERAALQRIALTIHPGKAEKPR